MEKKEKVFQLVTIDSYFTDKKMRLMELNHRFSDYEPDDISKLVQVALIIIKVLHHNKDNIR